MRELEETNCEIRDIINFDLPRWDQLDQLDQQDEPATTDGLKELNSPDTSGGYLNNECKFAWLSHKKRLIVINARYGNCVSSWSFVDKITSVSAFPCKQGHLPLLLIGTDNNAIRIKDSIGYLYIYDCNTSTILNIIQVPAGVEKACVIHGGAGWEEYMEKRPNTVLSGNSGLIFAALRNLQHVVIDINRSLWESAIYDGKPITAKLEFVNMEPLRSTLSYQNKNEPTCLAYNLMDREIEQYMGFDREDFEATPLYDESLCSVLLSSTKTGCLVTGCLGRIIIWQSDGSIGWISPPFDENAYVTHVALLEPSDDPRPFYYLWIACQNDSSDSSAVLRMYAMLFNRKHSEKSGESSLYFNLESEPSMKFELELEKGERVHTLTSVERENQHDSDYGEESLLLIGTDERLLLFDLNRWYKEQMPRTMMECRNPNSVMASYRTKPDDDEEEADKKIFASGYWPKSLREFPTKGPSSPEELFFPNALSLEWLDLAIDGVTHWIARGVQSELLKEITVAGPIVLLKPTETYRRCLAAGLVPFDSSPQDFRYKTTETEQRQMLMSLCLEQRWSGFLLRCATEWSDGSASYLYPEFLSWGVKRASDIKLLADQLCIPLFDQSGSNIGETEAKTLRFCEQQLDCLATVVSKLPSTEEDLERQRRALKRIATYLQVLLWFHDAGLLPETQEVDDETNTSQLALSMKIPYPRDRLIEIYKEKRSNTINRQEEILFIDQLMSHECLPLRSQWSREATDDISFLNGYYPPPSLQSLLRSFLIDCHRTDHEKPINEDDEFCDLPEMDSKHSVTIYLLMDLAMLLQGTYPAIDRLIKYPSAFKLTPSLIKLTQAFWLLDHEDYEGFFRIMTGELISMSDIRDWHHKLALATLLRNNEHKLALTYLRVLKPPLSSLEEQGTLIGLSVEHGLVETAFHSRPPSHYADLLTKFFRACKVHGKLKEILPLALDSDEEEAFVKFLKENECEDTRLLYYLHRCRHTEASNLFPNNTNLLNFGKKSTSQSPSSKSTISQNTYKLLNAYNSTLPEITKRLVSALNNVKTKLPPSINHLQPYQLYQQQPLRPQSRTYPQPMSKCRDSRRDMAEVAIEKTRETCLKAGRINTAVNFVPFLGAPCSTIVFCTRASGNPVPDDADANSVLYPEKKNVNGKRTREIPNDNADTGMERKRRRLGSISDTNLLVNEKNAEASRRLSMSQVCETPLVQRRGRDPNALTAETPHSILKIREMLRRNSGSPSFNFKNESPNGREMFSKPSGAGDVRSARQIRFSEDRFSANEDSSNSMNDTQQEHEDQESYVSETNRNDETDVGPEETYYSPSTSVKSLRDDSILSDSSIQTKNIRGPRPRPSLRKSSIISRNSSSNKSTLSDDTTMEASTLDVSPDKSIKISNISLISPRNKSLLATTLYASSILTEDTSFESSPFKKPMIVIERTMEQQSEDSETEDDASVSYINYTNIDKNSSVGPVSAENDDDEREEGEIREGDDEETDRNEEINEERENEGIEIKDDKTINESAISTNQNSSEANEISEDEGVEDEEDPNSQSEPDEAESFQSLSNSYDDGQTTPEKPQYRAPHNPLTDYSLTENLAQTPNKRVQNEEEQSNYSLTRPIFLDNRGFIKFGNPPVDITDDESMDAPEDIEKPNLESGLVSMIDNAGNDEEEEELNLNLSASESSDEKETDKSGRTNGFPSQKENSSPDISRTKESLSIVQKESSLEPRSRLSSLSSTKSEDLKGEGTPLRRSSRQACITKPSPRRSIKSVSSSSVARIREITPSSQEDVQPENASLMDELIVKQLESEDEESKKSPEFSPLSKRSISKSRTPSRQSSRESSQEKSVKLTPTKSKVSLTKDITTRKTRISSTDEEEKQTGSLRSKRFSSTIDEPISEEPMVEDSVFEEPVLEKKKGRSKTKVKDSTVIEEPTLEMPVFEEPVVEKKKTGRSRTTKAGKDTTVVEEVVEKRAGRSKIAKIASVSEEMVEDSVIEDVVDKTAGRTRTTRTTSAKEILLETTNKPEESQESEIVKKPRSTRASSQAKDITLKTSRKVRADSVTHDEEATPEDKPVLTRKTRAGSVLKDETTPEDKRTIARKTRAGSVLKDETTPEDKRIPTRKTRAGSVLKDETTPEDKRTTARKTRAGSVLKDEAIPEDKLIATRKTRAGSVIKDDDSVQISRKTRGTSVTKESVEEPKRATRASSVAKDAAGDDADDTTVKKGTRKRGGSIPKDVQPVLEPIRLQSRNRRSTSLLKEVILEESISHLDSPISNKRTRLPRQSVDEITSVTSSPAGNTRSRRSSIQSMPEDFIEEVPQTSSKTTSKKLSQEEVSRNRRAASVDSTVIVPAGKRVTRSVLAKTTIIEDVIPEEVASTKSPVTKKQTARRKRATSVPADAPDEKQKDNVKPNKPKRGRKASESKTFEFSPPEEAGEVPESTEGCRTPTFQFSEPTGLQKFLTPVQEIDYDEDLTDVMTTERITEMDKERPISSRVRRPRTVFVMPKKRTKSSELNEQKKK